MSGTGYRQHIWETRNDDLAACEVCHGGEGSLPVDCPGRRMTLVEQDSVYAGKLDFHGGQWWIPRVNGHNGLLRAALPMLVRLGDFVGNGPKTGPESLGERCALILDIKSALEQTDIPGIDDDTHS